MLGSDDNRDFMRMSVNADAKVIRGYNDAGEHEQVIDAVCQDLSATGASLQLDTAVPEREVIVIYIKAGKVPAFKAKAQVVRSEPLKDGQYQIGCRILEMM